MSELFTQTDKQKKLFRTEEDIVANIQTQFGMPHTGKDLLLDAKMGLNKDQSSRLDSEPDALSDTGMSDDVGAGDTSEILHDSAGGNKNTITGTNTPRSSRTSAYYDLLRSQHKNGHYKAPAYRVVDAIESPLQAGAGALNYHDDFDTDAVTESFYRGFGRTVDRGSGVSVESRCGTEVYDMPRVPLEHGGKEGTGHKEESFDVCVDGLNDIIDIVAAVRFEASCESCVIYEDIGGARFGKAAAGSVLYGILISYIEGIRRDFDSIIFFKAVLDGIKFFLVSCGKSQIIVVFCKCFGGSQSDAAGRPCDKCKFIHTVSFNCFPLLYYVFVAGG